MRNVQANDKVCFYLASLGVSACATVKTGPILDPSVISDSYPWVVQLSEPRLFLKTPVGITEGLIRNSMHFLEEIPSARWSWFVEIAHKITEHDFKLLTAHAKT